MSHPSSHQIFAIPELIEQIFLHLPLTDLLIRIPRVNKFFHSTINTSPLLQYKLFFSGPRNITQAVRKVDLDCIRPNPLLNPSFHAYVNPSRREWEVSESMPPLRRGELEGRELGYGVADENEMERKRVWTERFWRENASWKRMLVVMPPVKTLVISATSPMMTKFRLNDEEGVRMGMLDSKLLRGVWASLDVRGEEGILKSSEISIHGWGGV